MHLWLWDTGRGGAVVAVQGGRKCQQSWYAKYLLTKHKHIYFIICALRRPCILSSPQPALASSISLSLSLFLSLSLPPSVARTKQNGIAYCAFIMSV